MRVYISGAITDNPNFKRDFDIAQSVLESAGYEVINPAHLCEVIPNADWDVYMVLGETLMNFAEAIAMLPGWEKSKGAKIEKLEADRKRKVFVDIMKYLPFAEEGEKC